jgi:ADP-ribose pyrophosphatase YjhB (NUDIX family)
MMVSPDRLIVRPTGVLIEDNKILVVKQDVTETRRWALPGGRPEFGETIEQCLVREMKEETGLNVSVKDLLYVTDRFYRNTHVVHMLLLLEKIGGKLRSGKELELKTEKIRELAMVPVGRLQEYGFSPTFCQLVKSDFPGRGSYKGDYEKFYGML